MIAPALLASTAIILLSFVSEDAATISSALSIFGGPLSWPLGFAVVSPEFGWAISASILSLDAPAKMFCTVAGWRG